MPQHTPPSLSRVGTTFLTQPRPLYGPTKNTRGNFQQFYFSFLGQNVVSSVFQNSLTSFYFSDFFVSGEVEKNFFFSNSMTTVTMTHKKVAIFRKKFVRKLKHAMQG